MSSALWGIIVSLKFKLRKSLAEILKDFFNLRKSPWGYLAVIGFIILIYGVQIFRGRVNENVYWYTYFILLLQAIVFGGIEEIGWRYTWQPLIEEKHSFAVACTATFASWALWHYMYFYITDSLFGIDHLSFLIGLLGSCFILGAIYKISKSLWLCVFYHCLLNVLSQTLQPVGLLPTVVCNSIAIMISILVVKKID
jgi:membrane protease YdiL (CAAX protease family)